MIANSFRDSTAKKTVRERWNTPFLRYLHSEYGIRYRYMGLPGTDLADVRLWADMIEEVVAFELPSPGPDEKAWVKKLRSNMRRLGIPGVAFFGSFEEVVILRKDYDGQPYRQEKVITLYNLDFCDEISSKVETRESGKQLWRFEALRVILQDQRECYRLSGGPSRFIILLTVRNQIEATRINDFLNVGLLSETQKYCTTCQQIKRIPSHGPLIGTHAWALKAFLYNTLIRYFTAPNISALFFPLVKYTGTPIRLRGGKRLRSPMVHWMLLCKFEVPEAPAPSFCPPDFLEKVISLIATQTSIQIHPEPGEVANPNQPVSPVDWFQPFKSIFFTGKV